MQVTITAMYPGRERKVLLHKACRVDSALKMIDSWFSGMYQHSLDSDPYGVRYEVTVQAAHFPTVGVEFSDYVWSTGQDASIWEECTGMVQRRAAK